LAPIITILAAESDDMAIFGGATVESLFYLWALKLDVGVQPGNA
jgi:hypothetical protein